MRLLGIEGSPRKNGNTEKLVKTILDSAAENGAETTFYKLAKLKISPCMGCIECRETGACIIKDDMALLYDEIQAADAIVIGSPVYMWQVTGHTKMFMDRLVPFIKPDFSTRLNGKKKIFLAFTQGNPDPQLFTIYFDYLEKLFSFMKYDVKGKIIAHGTRGKEDILRQKDTLEKARDIGKNLAA